MRLIDADELEEKAWRFKLDSRELIAKMIEDAPTVDAVPVVRCKDCKHWETIVKNGATYGMCVAWEGLLHVTKKNGYCYKAERRRMMEDGK